LESGVETEGGVRGEPTTRKFQERQIAKLRENDMDVISCNGESYNIDDIFEFSTSFQNGDMRKDRSIFLRQDTVSHATLTKI
jgi:hypothetical protein